MQDKRFCSDTRSSLPAQTTRCHHEAYSLLTVYFLKLLLEIPIFHFRYTAIFTNTIARAHRALSPNQKTSSCVMYVLYLCLFSHKRNYLHWATKLYICADCPQFQFLSFVAFYAPLISILVSILKGSFTHSRHKIFSYFLSFSCTNWLFLRHNWDFHQYYAVKDTWL